MRKGMHADLGERAGCHPHDGPRTATCTVAPPGFQSSAGCVLLRRDAGVREGLGRAGVHDSVVTDVWNLLSHAAYVKSDRATGTEFVHNESTDSRGQYAWIGT